MSGRENSDFRAEPPGYRVRLLRLVNGPIDEPVGSRAYEKRLLQRQILIRYEVGGQERKTIAAELGLSLRQFHRERRVAMQWVADRIERAPERGADKPRDLFDAERLTLVHLAPDLSFADACRRFEILLSRQTDPTSRVSAHFAFYDFLVQRDDRDAIRHRRPTLQAEIAALADDGERSAAQAHARMIDAQIAWRDGLYADAVAAVENAAGVVRPFADLGMREHASALCVALQLKAQLRWETGGAADALDSLNLAENVIERHGLQMLPFAVTNLVGRSDLLMRDAACVPHAIDVATTAFDRAATFGDDEDAAGALLIIAMARCGQGHATSALEHAGYALEFADGIAPVGRSRLFAHVAEILIIQRCFSKAAALLEQARLLVPVGSIAYAQQQLRAALLAEATGRKEEAHRIVNKAILDLEEKGAHRFIGPGLKIRARIRWAVGDTIGAITDIENAVSRLCGQSYAWTYAQALGHFGHVAKKRNLVHEAYALRNAMKAG